MWPEMSIICAYYWWQWNVAILHCKFISKAQQSITIFIVVIRFSDGANIFVVKAKAIIWKPTIYQSRPIHWDPNESAQVTWNWLFSRLFAELRKFYSHMLQIDLNRFSFFFQSVLSVFISSAKCLGFETEQFKENSKLFLYPLWKWGNSNTNILEHTKSKGFCCVTVLAVISFWSNIFSQTDEITIIWNSSTRNSTFF